MGVGQGHPSSSALSSMLYAGFRSYNTADAERVSMPVRMMRRRTARGWMLASRSEAVLVTSAAATSRSRTLKSSLVEAALEGMNLSLYVTRDLGEKKGFAPSGTLLPSSPRKGEETGVRGSDAGGWLVCELSSSI
jgi:hypothetical protein